MDDDYFDSVLPALAGFIVAYYILSSGGTFMEALFYSLLNVGLTLIGTFIIRVYIVPRFDKKREKKIIFLIIVVLIAALVVVVLGIDSDTAVRSLGMVC